MRGHAAAPEKGWRFRHVARPCAERVIAPGAIADQSLQVDAHPARLVTPSCASPRCCSSAPAASPRRRSRRPTTSSSSAATRRSRSRAASTSGCSTSTASCAWRRHVDQRERRLHRARTRSLQTCWDLATAGQQLHERPLALDHRLGRRRDLARDRPARAVGTNRAGGSLVIRAARVSLGGGVETAGTNAALGRHRRSTRPGSSSRRRLHAPGNNIIVHGGAGVLDRRRRLERRRAIPRPAPTRAA